MEINSMRAVPIFQIALAADLTPTPTLTPNRNPFLNSESASKSRITIMSSRSRHRRMFDLGGSTLSLASCIILVAALLTGNTRATILTFEDFPANNAEISTVANPFGVGQYGSRAASAINPGFQVGDGWTPNVVLAWSAGWQTYTGWP